MFHEIQENIFIKLEPYIAVFVIDEHSLRHIQRLPEYNRQVLVFCHTRYFKLKTTSLSSSKYILYCQGFIVSHFLHESDADLVATGILLL